MKKRLTEVQENLIRIEVEAGRTKNIAKRLGLTKEYVDEYLRSSQTTGSGN